VVFAAADGVEARAVVLDSSAVGTAVSVGSVMLVLVACGGFDSTVDGCAIEAGAQAARSRATVNKLKFTIRIGFTSNLCLVHGRVSHALQLSPMNRSACYLRDAVNERLFRAVEGEPTLRSRIAADWV
jgi:hypothetical protein